MKPPLFIFFEKAAEACCRYASTDSYIIRPDPIFKTEFVVNIDAKRDFVTYASRVLYGLFVSSGIAALIFKLCFYPSDHSWLAFCAFALVIIIAMRNILLVRYLNRRIK